jgi:hypothetical protein
MNAIARLTSGDIVAPFQRHCLPGAYLGLLRKIENFKKCLIPNGAPDTIRTCDLCLRRAAVRSADDLLVTAYVRAAVYLRLPSATRCKGAAKSIRFPARHAQALDDYHLSLPRVELDKPNQPDVRRLKPARLPCRHRLLGIETVPISPMLHQLRARVEKRRRSVAHVEFRSRGGSRD